jgi:soluble lytic murein transglycosylase-like protein
MNRSPLRLALLIAVSGLTASFVAAQDRQSFEKAADAAKLRTGNSVARQRKALSAMAESVASQQLSVERQRRNPISSGFFGFGIAGIPDHTVTSVMACDSLPPAEVDNLVDMAAARTSVSPQLIRSVMRQESSFHACAVSAKGAMGLMQLLPQTASNLGVTDAFNPEANVLGGATLLKQLLERYGGDLSLTLSAYNAGLSKVDAATGVPMIPETIDYVRRILSQLPAAPATRLREDTETDDQSGRDSAPAISFWLTETAGTE